MTINFNRGAVLASGRVAPAATEVAVLTVAAAAVEVATASLVNVTGAQVTVSVSVFPAGAASDGTHRIVASYPLGALDGITQEDVLSSLKGACLDAGAQLVVNCSAPAALDYVVTGRASS